MKKPSQKNQTAEQLYESKVWWCHRKEAQIHKPVCLTMFDKTKCKDCHMEKTIKSKGDYLKMEKKDIKAKADKKEPKVKKEKTFSAMSSMHTMRYLLLHPEFKKIAPTGFSTEELQLLTGAPLPSLRSYIGYFKMEGRCGALGQIDIAREGNFYTATKGNMLPEEKLPEGWFTKKLEEVTKLVAKRKPIVEGEEPTKKGKKQK